MKQVTKKNVKKVCLLLWKKLSQKDMHIGASPTDLKNRILKELGYKECLKGCPLCDVYFNKMCIFGECTFNNKPCLKSDYSEWAEFVVGNHISSKKLANKFYQELKRRTKNHTRKKSC